ncbi:putative iron-regulated membrane protein [Methylorubrum rhodinum]|uniref:Putative iron-regulated membrane protein n=1 Tax=Methylorubrum rhodinum TaxID=29428 RepID=A0A840ZRP6_9HYPH|nr:PepSY domain-containing protein [Methylorubrum rhodinum]MBB5759705.1 putative iron-regulated membrane protein [Methylorubrum rhodinum]
MSVPFQGPAPAAARAEVRPSLREAVYRAVWRWHFYAGLICLPFLILLAVTGALYLFKPEIDATAFAHRTIVTPAGTPLGPDRLVYNAMQAVPDGVPVSYTEPGSPTASALVTMNVGAEKTLVFLDPYRGHVLDAMPAAQEFSGVVRRLHSLTLFGSVANRVVEIVAGFAVILVVTGTYLWWPRGQRGGVVTLRETPRRRVWWRDLHAVTGLFAGAGLLFLALTGLPWSGWWGQELRAWSNAAGLGQPRQLWADRPVSGVPMRAVLNEPGWTMQDAPVPRSQPQAAPAIGLDRAAAILRDMGMPAGFELALPLGETGVYAVAAYPRDVTAQRMVSLDQYTGRPLVDVHFGDIGPVGQAIQLGIGLHKGEFLGRANQLAMLAFCLATILLSVTAGVMWWKRRPSGRLGVPPLPRDRRVMAGVTGLVLGLGALFPLTGLAILALIGLDLGARALLRPRPLRPAGQTS